MTLEDEKPPATISEIIAMRLVEARRGVTQAQLADRLRGMGVKMDRASIAKIEARAKRSKTKARKVTVEELFLLAAALGVSPLHLVLPLDDQSRVEISPTITRPGETDQGLGTWTDASRETRCAHVLHRGSAS